MRRYQRRSNLKVWFVLLSMVAVLGGVVYAFRHKIRDAINERLAKKPTPTKDTKPPKIAKPLPEPVKVPEPVKDRVIRPEPLRLSVTERNLIAARRYRKKAEAAWKKLDFEEAAGCYAREAKLLANDPARASRPRALGEKAGAFAEAVSGLELNPEAKGDLVIVRLDGTDIPGALIEENDEFIIIARRKGMRRLPIPKDEVIEVVRLSEDERRARLLEDFAEVERKYGGAEGAALSVVFKRAYRDGLQEKALKYLEKAYAGEGKDLAMKVHIYEASDMLRHALWNETSGRTIPALTWCASIEKNFSDLKDIVAEARAIRERVKKPVKLATVTIKEKKKWPGTRPTRTRPTRVNRAGGGEVTVETTKIASGSGRNAELVAQINSTFDQAMDHYVKGRPGNPSSNRHLKQAAALFEKVVNLCERALRRDRGNSQLKSRQADAARLRYQSTKMTTL